MHSARKLKLNPGSIVAMDRAYNDFKLFERWSAEGVFFVTRMKEGTLYEVVESREVPQLWLNLFTYRDLTVWLAEPFGTPPEVTAPDHFQLG